MTKKGVIKFPKKVKRRRVIRYWLEYLERTDLETPLVVEEEHYTRQSVMKKLGPDRGYSVNRNLVQALIEYGRIRSGNHHKLQTHGQPVSNLSLAETISGGFQEPLEKILLSEHYFESREFKRKSPSERIKILVNAYTGVKWFEIFKGRFQSMEQYPRVNARQNIRLNDI